MNTDLTQLFEGQNVYFEQDFDGFVGDFIKKYYTRNSKRLAYFFDGHLHCYNGTHYERMTDANLQVLSQRIREYVKTLRFVDKKQKPVLTPTSPLFYKTFITAMNALCEVTGDQVKPFKTQPPNLVYGRTKIWNILTDTYEAYSPVVFNTYTLDYDVAEYDEEPAVWDEFFESAGMDEKQRRSWWWQRAVILMRDRKHHRIFYHFGNPRSGKGLTTCIDMAFFGKNRTAALPRNIGTNDHGTSIIVDKALLTINDMKFDKHINNGFIQFLLNCIGDDPITINPKYKTPFDYMPDFNIVISSNERPNFKGNLSGIENKFVFNVFHRTKEIDRTLKDRMLETMPHIIRKAAKVYQDAVESGYDFDTEQGRTISEQFLESSSIVRQFIEDQCVFDKERYEKTLVIYHRFRDYAKARGEHLPTLSQFTDEITTQYLGLVTKDRVREHDNSRPVVFKGMCLKESRKDKTEEANCLTASCPGEIPFDINGPIPF